MKFWFPQQQLGILPAPHLDSEVEIVTVKVKRFVIEININTRPGLETTTVSPGTLHQLRSPRSFVSTLLPSLSPNLSSRFSSQGPALFSYNDAKFRKEDWKGIRLVSASIKVEDPMKVGRFGLGFKSVLHMTGN